jgi:protein-S-isoprenylcysteine O-methyltransferase Ste14
LWFTAAICSSLAIWVGLALYSLAGIGDAYDRGDRFPERLLPVWYAMWSFHHLPVAVASLAGVWQLPVSPWLAGAGCTVALASGTAALTAGMTRLGSYARSAGQDTSELITSGIYRWCRNPQFVGWFLLLFGVSIAGRSGLSLLLTGAFAVVVHSYTVHMEEPHLERIHGERYRRYKAVTPRYFGLRGEPREATK